MVVYYSTPDEVRRQHAESERYYAMIKRVRAHFWRDFAKDMERARARVKWQQKQMACKYGWNERAISEAAAERKSLRSIQMTAPPSVPKEAEARNKSSEPLQQLIEAIGRHPAAESDPDVIDAINALEDALTS